MEAIPSKEPEGLTVKIDRVVYHHDTTLPPDRPHAFIYFITINNASDRTVTLLARKWVIRNADGTQLVVEGDKIVGETPTLSPGESWSYNSFHITDQAGTARGSFHGVDEAGQRILVRIPVFRMDIPGESH